METVQWRSILDDEIVLVEEALVGVEVVPVGLLARAAVGEDVNGDAQDVCQTVELALGLVEGVERLLSREELEELWRAGDRLLSDLAGVTFNFDLKLYE